LQEKCARVCTCTYVLAHRGREARHVCCILGASWGGVGSYVVTNAGTQIYREIEDERRYRAEVLERTFLCVLQCILSVCVLQYIDLGLSVAH
jgi:hypothetical protein